MKIFPIPETIRGMYTSLFNFIHFLRSGVISLKQRRIKFKPRIKLNHNICKLSAQRSQKFAPLKSCKTAHVRASEFRNRGNFLLVESGILGLGIRNTAQGIRNPTNDWNTKSKFHWQKLESEIHSVRWGREWKGREENRREVKGRERKEREGKGREGKGKEGNGRGGKGREWKAVSTSLSRMK